MTGDELLDHCERWGIVKREALQALRDAHTGTHDVTLWEGWLIEGGLLTKYQAEEIRQWRGEKLVVGECVVEAPLGSGAMGIVYRGKDRTLNRTVAIKVITSERNKNRSADFQQRFEREFQILAKLDHNHIVRCYSAGSAHQAAYFVMEYVEGTTLEDYVEDCGNRMSLRESIEVVLQATRGIAYAHSLNVVHRDLKPGNLMRRPDGVIKIMDFGLAVLDSESAARFTSTGDTFGTLDYMAPSKPRTRVRWGRRRMCMRWGECCGGY